MERRFYGRMKQLESGNKSRESIKNCSTWSKSKGLQSKLLFPLQSDNQSYRSLAAFKWYCIARFSGDREKPDHSQISSVS